MDLDIFKIAPRPNFDVLKRLQMKLTVDFSGIIKQPPIFPYMSARCRRIEVEKRESERERNRERGGEGAGRKCGSQFFEWRVPRETGYR